MTSVNPRTRSPRLRRHTRCSGPRALRRRRVHRRRGPVRGTG
jgi:hypothetical protein